LPAQAQADGFYTQGQSVKGSGRAYSGEVADRGAASLWWNPAAIGGMTQRSVSLGALYVAPSGNVDDLGTVIVRPGQDPASVGGVSSAKDPTEGGLLPSGAIAIPVNDRITFGLAITSPYNVVTEYDADSWTRYNSLKTKISAIDFQPSVGIQVNDWLRLGLGLNIERVESEQTSRLPNLSPLLPDGDQSLEGSGWDLGWSLGAQAERNGVVFGASYKTSIEHELKGSLKISGLLGPLAGSNQQIDGVSTFSTPWQAIVGVRAPIDRRLTVNAQIVRYGWSEFDAIRLGAPINQALPKNYRDTWSVAAGVDYALDDAWTLRGGLQHAQTPTQDCWRDAAVPDADRWTFAVGGSRRVSPSLTYDAAFNYVHAGDSKIDRPDAAFAGTPVQTPTLVNGSLRDGRALILAIGARATF
jgi:long-chain fatty acid transport protein